MTDLQRLLDELTALSITPDGELSCPFCEAFETARDSIRSDLLQADYMLSSLTPPDEAARMLVLAIRNKVNAALSTYNKLAGV
jgi:hypothetical protein